MPRHLHVWLAAGLYNKVLETTPIAICHMTARRLSSASSIANH
jgi:hypothetical protein